MVGGVGRGADLHFCMSAMKTGVVAGGGVVAADARGVRPGIGGMAGRIYNFSAGPSQLPDEVIEQAKQDIGNIALDGVPTGMGIMEHSHRAKTYDRILMQALENCRKIGNIHAGYSVLFTTGGATTQNHQVPMNLLRNDQTADYLTTGYWAERSFEAAQMFGTIHEAWDGRPNKHAFVPSDDQIKWSKNPTYVHICSNNTIYGTQWRNADGSQRVPKAPNGAPLVCDMCSDIFSRPFNVDDFGLIYAGAQKNIGIAGCSLVIIRNDLLKVNARELPLMLRYDVTAKDESRHNTPPVFPIYMAGLMFEWIIKQGGTAALHKRNVEKAAVIYRAIDESRGFYIGHAREDSRSLMNITFRCPTAALDDLFVAEALKNGMDNLRGHRATGGMRASVYNAMPMAGAEYLASFMRDFARKNG